MILKKRILSGFVMLPLLFIVHIGGFLLLALCSVIGILAVREFFDGFKETDIRPSHVIAYAGAVTLSMINLFVLLYNAAGLTVLYVTFFNRAVVLKPPETYGQLYMLWFFFVITASLLYMFNVKKRRLSDGAVTITGIFYVVFLLNHIFLTDQLGEYGILVWLILLTAFGTDIMAYFTGYFIGKHKLCPEISPKKTVEGAAGGVVGSVLLCLAFGYFFTEGTGMAHFAVLGALGGVISQFGDLTASVFKRMTGIKDYGKLIPGHGGVLDRIDSVLFTAPMVYYYIQFIIV